MKREEYVSKITRSLELLGNPLRFKIYLKILKEGCDCDIKTQTGYAGNCVSGIVKDLKLPQSTVSSYLRDLELGGLIECEKNGKFVYCRPNKNTLKLIQDFTKTALSQITY